VVAFVVAAVAVAVGPAQRARARSVGVTSLILYDGDCRTCHALVRWILPRDREGRFRFASQDSAVGQRALAEHGLLAERGKTIVLLEDGLAYLRSEAALRIAARLSGPAAGLLAAAARLLPRPLRDGAYDAFAGRRHRLLGRAGRCLVVGPEWRERFLEGEAAPHPVTTACRPR
jgi:predicted DCC family thiol-disulfide oxidoreductase YuxK